LKKSDLHVPNDVKQLVKAGLKDEVAISPRIYDQMQKDVKRIIQETTYPNFLQSDMYLNYVQHATRENVAITETIINDIFATATTTTSSTTISESSSKFHLSRSSTLPTLVEEGDGSSLTDHLSELPYLLI
jgi:axin 1